MNSAPAWIAGSVLLPLVAAVATLFLGRRSAARVGTAAAWTIFGVSIVIAVQVLRGGPQSQAPGGWPAPLGIPLYADGLSAVMLVMAGGVGALVSVYAIGYFDRPAEAGHDPEDGFFWPLWMFLWAALNAIFVSGDLFNLYVGLELLSLGGVALVTVGGGRVALIAGMRYLLVSLLGSLAYLLGVALLYGSAGVLDLASLAEYMSAGSPAVVLALALITTGLVLKSALFPLHFWLPPAHASAPAPVSALLSALVVKASFFVLLRLWFDVFPAELTRPAGELLGVLGALAILWGSILALQQRRLKLLIAYSTVAQIGYLFLLFPLTEPGASWAAEAWSGGVLHAVSHACAKAAMFMAAGSIATAVGGDELDGLAGVASRLPISLGAFSLAGISLMGLPPSGGFVAKWLLLSAAVESGAWWIAAVVLLGGLLAAGYVVRVIEQALLPAPQEVPPTEAGMSPTVAQWPALALALVALLLGLMSAPLLEVLRVAAPFPAP